MELVLPEAAELSEIAPGLLAPRGFGTCPLMKLRESRFGLLQWLDRGAG